MSVCQCLCVCVCVCLYSSHLEEQQQQRKNLLLLCIYLSLCRLFIPVYLFRDGGGCCSVCFSCPQVVQSGSRHPHRTAGNFMVSVSFFFLFFSFCVLVFFGCFLTVRAPVEEVCDVTVPLLCLNVMRIYLRHSLSCLSSSTVLPLAYAGACVRIQSSACLSSSCSTWQWISLSLSLFTAQIQRNGKTSSNDYKQAAAPAGIQSRSASPFFFCLRSLARHRAHLDVS